MNAAAPASLTARLAALIAARPITAEDYRAAALFTLDALANALAGRQTAPGRILLDWAAAEPLTMGREALRSEEHTSELQSLMRISYAVFCLKKKKRRETTKTESNNRTT